MGPREAPARLRRLRIVPLVLDLTASVASGWTVNALDRSARFPVAAASPRSAPSHRRTPTVQRSWVTGPGRPAAQTSRSLELCALSGSGWHCRDRTVAVCSMHAWRFSPAGNTTGVGAVSTARKVPEHAGLACRLPIFHDARIVQLFWG